MFQTVSACCCIYIFIMYSNVDVNFKKSRKKFRCCIIKFECFIFCIYFYSRITWQDSRLGFTVINLVNTFELCRKVLIYFIHVFRICETLYITYLFKFINKHTESKVPTLDYPFNTSCRFNIFNKIYRENAEM